MLETSKSYWDRTRGERMSLFIGWQGVVVIIILMWVWSEWFSRKLGKTIEEKYAPVSNDEVEDE